VSYNPENPTELTISVSRDCTENQLYLTITAESLGMRLEKGVTLYLYEIEEPLMAQTPLKAGCASLTELGAEDPFLFTDIPAAIPLNPLQVIMSVTYIIGMDPEIGPIAESRRASIEIEVSWVKPNGDMGTYVVPAASITMGRVMHRKPALLFTVPREMVFRDLSVKAVPGVVTLRVTTGTDQVIEKRFSVWIHDGTTYPAYLRSFHFDNSPCSKVTWSMWEKFWGEDAVWDYLCVFGYRIKLWKDLVSEFLYESVFKEMCQEGRCSSYALTGQKFAEEPPAVVAIDRCASSSPHPFTLTKYTQVTMREEPPSASFDMLTMDLDTYLTYQYMWLLEERNLKRGV